jgi:hypothetical protein
MQLMEKQGLACLEGPKAVTFQLQTLEEVGSAFSYQLEQDWGLELAFCLGRNLLI